MSAFNVYKVQLIAIFQDWYICIERHVNYKLDIEPFIRH